MTILFTPPDAVGDTVIHCRSVDTSEVMIQNQRGEELEFEVLGEDLLIIRTIRKGDGVNGKINCDSDPGMVV